MGHSISFACVKGKDREAVLEALGMEDGEPRSRRRGAGVEIGQLPKGWTLVRSNDFDAALKLHWLDGLSSGGCEVIACQVEEHVMFSKVAGRHADGAAWSVTYDCENDGALEVEGAPPAQFKNIEADARAEQEAADDDVDILFDIPSRLVNALTDYTYDEGKFKDLTPARPKSGSPGASGGGFFARLFGRR